MKITILDEGKVPVTRGMAGIFLEDINYALDGGLYAEMLENRNFEAKDVSGEGGNFVVEEDGGYGWESYPKKNCALLKVKTDRPLFPENPHYMRLTATAAGTGMKNKAYDGIYLKKGEKYKISFYARSYDYKGSALVGVYFNGAPVLLKKCKFKPDGGWHKYSFRVKAKLDCDKADFVFLLQKAGMVHLDAFSMMPESALFGVFRRDLAEQLKALKPGFLRFPGGCVVEGNNLQNRYQWKNSTGATERRKFNWNRWSLHGGSQENNFHTEHSHYGQTLGVGYFEYFRLCEYLGAKPFPVVNLGMACQFVSTQLVAVEDEEFENYIQEALDVVEFARGGVDTVWGRVRAEMGHPQPFELGYLGLGNEQWEMKAENGKRGNEFFKRVEMFEKRLHEKYPDLKLIGTAGPEVDAPKFNFDEAWEWTRNHLKENENFVYATDEHFYKPPKWLYENASRYDNYPRTAKVCAGEFAAHVPHENGVMPLTPQANCFESALAEAAVMTGFERNADIVVMSCYAPLFARLGYTQWSPNLIWFDGKRSVATPNYYVQQLYSLYTGDYSFKISCEEKDIYASATEREGMTFVKIVNASAEEKEAEIEGVRGSLTRIIRLEGEAGDYNSLEEPFRVAPKDVAPTSPNCVTLPPHTFSVLVFM